MEKKYEEIKFTFKVRNIEDVVNELLEYKSKGLLVCGAFNGKTLYSDTVTLDGAYKEITGKTKAEFDKMLQEKRDRYEKEQREHEEKTPKLTLVWQKKGREILSEDKWEYWDKIVPIRLRDLYQGMELGCCLDIIKILNNDGTLDEAKEKIENQEHSGMSFGLVCSMVKEFCVRGSEFVDFVR